MVTILEKIETIKQNMIRFLNYFLTLFGLELKPIQCENNYPIGILYYLDFNKRKYIREKK